MRSCLMQELGPDEFFAIGISTDGVSIGGREVLQTRARSALCGGYYFTVSLPPIVLNKESPAEVEALIRADHYHSRAPEPQRQFLKSTIGQAGLYRRLQQYLSFSTLGAGALVVQVSDQGSATRQFATWKMDEGEAFIELFDGPHRDSRDMLLVGLQVLPVGFERMLRLRSCAGGAHSIKIGEMVTIVSNWQQSIFFEVVGANRVEVEGSLNLTIDSPSFEMEFKRNMHAMRSSMSTFSGSKRLGKLSLAARWMVKHWDVLEMIVRLIVRREKPALLDIRARLKLTQDKFSNDRVRVVYDSGDLSALDLDREEERMRLKKQQGELQKPVGGGARDDGFGESSDEDADWQWSKSKKTAVSNKSAQELQDTETKGQDVSSAATAAVAAVDALPVPSPDHKKRKANCGVAVGLKEGGVAGAGAASTKKTGAGAASTKNPTTCKRPAAPKDATQEKALLPLVYILLSDLHSRLRITVFAHSQKAPCLHHNISIAATHNYIQARGLYWAQGPSMLADLGRDFNGELGASFDPVLTGGVAKGLVAQLYGECFGEMMSRGIRTIFTRQARWMRILIYGIKGSGDLTVEDLKNVDYTGSASLKSTIGSLLADPEIAEFFEASRPLCSVDVFNTDLFSDPTKAEDAQGDSESHLLPRDPAPVLEVRVPNFTNPNHQRLQKPADYERFFAKRLEDIARLDTVMAKELVTMLMNSNNYWHVKKFNEAVVARNLQKAENLVVAIQKANPVTTRDIEARGGSLSKAACDACNSGAVVGNIPWHIFERLVPMWIPFLRPTDKDGTQSKKGVLDSWSVIDDKIVMPEDRTIDDVRADMFPEGEEFEDNAPGLVDLELMMPVVDELCKDSAEGTYWEKLATLTDKMKNTPRPGKKQVADFVRKLTFLNREDHGLTREQVQRMLKFVFNHLDLPKIVCAEMIMMEQYLYVANKSVTAADRWDRGRCWLWLLAGIRQRYRARRKPLCFVIKSGATGKYFSCTDTVVQARSAVMTELEAQVARVQIGRDQPVMTDFDSDGEPEDEVVIDQDRMAKESAMEHGGAFWTEGKRKSKNADSTRLFCQLAEKDKWDRNAVQDDTQVWLSYPEKPENYTIPFPITARAAESKLRAFMLTPDKVDSDRAGTTSWTYDCLIATSAQYAFRDEDRTVRIHVHQKNWNRTILATALKEGLLWCGDKWVEGEGKFSMIGLLKDLVVFIMRDDPARIRCLMDGEFIYYSEHDNRACAMAARRGETLADQPQPAPPQQATRRKRRLRLDAALDDLEFGGNDAEAWEPDAAGLEADLNDDPMDVDGDNASSAVLNNAGNAGKQTAGTGLLGGSSSSLMLNGSSAVGGGASSSSSSYNRVSNLPRAAEVRHRKLDSLQVLEQTHAALRAGTSQQGVGLFGGSSTDPELEQYERMAAKATKLQLTTTQEWGEVLAVLLMGQRDAEDWFNMSRYFQKTDEEKGAVWARGKKMITIQKSCSAAYYKLSELADIDVDHNVLLKDVFARKGPGGAARAGEDGGADGDAAANKKRKPPTAEQVQRNLNAMNKKYGVGMGNFALAGEQDEDNDASEDDDANLVCEEVAGGRGGGRSADELRKAIERVKQQFESVPSLQKQLEKSKGTFHNPNINIIEEHAKELPLRRQLVCPRCRQAVEGWVCRRHWIASGGPRLEFWKKDSDKTYSRGLGPRCHTIRHRGNKRCWCGWWKNKRLWKELNGDVETGADGVWRCARIFAVCTVFELENKAKVCGCSDLVVPKEVPIFSNADTFTYQAKPAGPRAQGNSSGIQDDG
eukprot:g9683.t1